MKLRQSKQSGLAQRGDIADNYGIRTSEKTVDISALNGVFSANAKIIAKHISRVYFDIWVINFEETVYEEHSKNNIIEVHPEV